MTAVKFLKIYRSACLRIDINHSRVKGSKIAHNKIFFKEEFRQKILIKKLLIDTVI